MSIPSREPSSDPSSSSTRFFLAAGSGPLVFCSWERLNFFGARDEELATAPDDDVLCARLRFWPLEAETKKESGMGRCGWDAEGRVPLWLAARKVQRENREFPRRVCLVFVDFLQGSSTHSICRTIALHLMERAIGGCGMSLLFTISRCLSISVSPTLRTLSASKSLVLSSSLYAF